MVASSIVFTTELNDVAFVKNDMNMQGQAGSYRGPGNGSFRGGGDRARTAEQEAVYQEVIRKAREELNSIKDEKDRLRRRGTPLSTLFLRVEGSQVEVETTAERWLCPCSRREFYRSCC